MGSSHKGQKHSLPDARDQFDQGELGTSHRHPNEERDGPCDRRVAVSVDAQDCSVRRGDSRSVGGGDNLQRSTPEGLASRRRNESRCLTDHRRCRRYGHASPVTTARYCRRRGVGACPDRHRLNVTTEAGAHLAPESVARNPPSPGRVQVPTSPGSPARTQKQGNLDLDTAVEHHVVEHVDGLHGVVDQVVVRAGRAPPPL